MLAPSCLFPQGCFDGVLEGAGKEVSTDAPLLGFKQGEVPRCTIGCCPTVGGWSGPPVLKQGRNDSLHGAGGLGSSALWQEVPLD